MIIPVWNREKLLGRAVRSIISQTLSPREIIIVNDGSADNTSKIIEDFIEEFQDYSIEVKCINIEHCGMVGKVRNVGIVHAKSEWVAFLDSDDEWLPSKLEQQQKKILETNMYWCHTKERWMRKGKIKSQRGQRYMREGNIFEDALQKCIIGPSTVLIKKSMFEKIGFFREDLEIAEDYELWLRFLDRQEIAYVNEELIIKHAGHGNQLSEKYDYIECFRIDALEKLIEKEFFCYNNMRSAKEKLEAKKNIWKQGKLKHGSTKQKS